MNENYSSLKFENKSKVDQIETIITPTLDYVQVGIPEFTTHGRIHSVNLVEMINTLSKKILFSEAELFILYCSSWLHDIGCIKDRLNHNEKTIEILDQHPIFETIVTPKAYPLIKNVILAHSSNYKKIDEIPLLTTLFSEDDTRLRLISALFRLIDGCDITTSRVDCLLYNIKKGDLPPENKIHWDAHRDIQNIVFDTENKVVKVYTEGEIANILIDHLEEEYNSVSKIFIDHDIPLLSIEREQIPKYKYELGNCAQ
jgi:hypothetical protein